VNAADRRNPTPEEIQRELARILAAGYLRLCEDATQGAKNEGSQQRSGAPGGQECAPGGAGEGP
jgi:hypothetical protein